MELLIKYGLEELSVEAMKFLVAALLEQIKLDTAEIEDAVVQEFINARKEGKICSRQR